jgi:glutathione synthase/RimK-type ligase-like ATP-grasp enzyme
MMDIKPIDISGGKSVYCINEAQMKKALELANENPESAERIQNYLKRIESDLNRNERAALAFVIVDNLIKSH